MTIGGLAWLLITGAVINAWWAIGLILLIGIFSIVTSFRYIDRYPGRERAILGTLMLWVIVVNFVFANAIYDRIPDYILGISSGKAQFSLLCINLFLGLLSFLGFGLVLKDISEKG